MKKKDYKIVEVTWVDAEEKGESGWNDLKEQLAYKTFGKPLYLEEEE